MEKGHKIRLNPTPEQEAYFRQAAGCARFVYNWGLEQWKEQYQSGGKPNAIKLKKQFNAIKRTEFPFVMAVTKTVVEGAFKNLGQAFSHFFQALKEGRKVGYPKFKSKRNPKQSFYIANDKIRFDGHQVYIPKLGWVNMTEPLRFSGKVMSATVSLAAGWWWLSVNVKVKEPRVSTQPRPAIGADFNLGDLVVTSDGEVYENQGHLKKSLTRLKRLQRSLSRKVKGSKNYMKAHLKLARAHYRVACQRLDFIHQMTTHLCRENAIIGIEDLNVKGMLSNHHVAQSLSDASFGEIRRQLAYKGRWFSTLIQAVDRFFPSSQLCHVCLYQNDELTLSDREWMCPACGSWHQRDVNAARNIRDEAIRLIAASGSGYVGRETLVDRGALAHAPA